MKRKLNISGFQAMRLNSMLIGSYEVIMIAIIFSMLFGVVSGFKFHIYLLNGVMLPLYFTRFGVQLGDYWFWFSLLLLIRMGSTLFMGLDVNMVIVRLYW